MKGYRITMVRRDGKPPLVEDTPNLYQALKARDRGMRLASSVRSVEFAIVLERRSTRRRLKPRRRSAAA